MRMRSAGDGMKAISMGLLLFLLPFIFHARVLNAQDGELTLEEAVRIALAKNEQALAADARLSAAEARVARARMPPALTPAAPRKSLERSMASVS